LKKGYDKLRFNIPTSNEIAAVFTCNADGDILPANVVVHEGGKTISHLKPLDPMVEPMLYPLFNPYGDNGWNINITDNKGKKVTMLQYARSKLAVRKDGKFVPYHMEENCFSNG
jgi:hypothetical protein